MYRGGMCTIPWNINKKMFCWHYSIIWYLCGFSFLFLLISFWWIWLSNAHMNMVHREPVTRVNGCAHANEILYMVYIHLEWLCLFGRQQWMEPHSNDSELVNVAELSQCPSKRTRWPYVIYMNVLTHSRPVCKTFWKVHVQSHGIRQWHNGLAFQQTHIMDNFSAYLFGLFVTTVIEWPFSLLSECSIWWLIIAHLRQAKIEEMKKKNPNNRHINIRISEQHQPE